MSPTTTIKTDWGLDGVYSCFRRSSPKSFFPCASYLGLGLLDDSFVKYFSELKMIHAHGRKFRYSIKNEEKTGGPGNRGPSECGTPHEATSGMSSFTIFPSSQTLPSSLRKGANLVNFLAC